MPPKTTSPSRRQPAVAPTLHPTVLSVLHLLYHLPAVRRAVWECTTIPPAAKGAPPADLQPHRFVRVLQQLFVKIYRNEPWSTDDMQWSQKIVNIPGHVCFDICRNYMVGLLITAIPELDDLFSYSCEHEHQYPDIGAVEIREVPDIPLTFGTPAHDTVTFELTDAGQMGHGNLQQVKISEDMSEEVRDKWAEVGLGEGDLCMRLTTCRYDREAFPAMFVLDRWTIHPCVPGKTKRGDSMMMARMSPHPQIRPPLEIDMAPLFPWPQSGHAEPEPLMYDLHSVAVLRGYDWAENFAEGLEVQGNVVTSMGIFAVYINNNMNGEWLEVHGRQVRPVTRNEMGTLLLTPNAMVTSYVYIARDRIPELFPPPSSVEPPALLLARQCANPSCGAMAEEGTAHARCSRCHTVGYCQPECQKAHWKTHKIVCSSTECLDDVFIPPEPPATIRPPFGLHCSICIPLMVKREHEWLSKQSWEQLIQFAMAARAPLPKNRAKLQKMTPSQLADILIEHTHPGVLKKRKEKKSAVEDKQMRETDLGDEHADADDENNDDDDDDDDDDDMMDDGPLPATRAVRRPGSKSESAMQSYALPVIVAMLAILVAFSWLG